MSDINRPDAFVPRLEPLAQMPVELRELVRHAVPPRGDELNVFATLARHPNLVGRFAALTNLLRNESSVPFREREIVILRVAARTDCVYEYAQHESVARSAGLSEAEIRAAIFGGPSDWSDREGALIRLVDELHDGSIISDDTYQAVQDGRTDIELIDLVMLVGLYHMTAWFMNGFQIQPEEGLPRWPSP